MKKDSYGGQKDLPAVAKDHVDAEEDLSLGENRSDWENQSAEQHWILE